MTKQLGYLIDKDGNVTPYKQKKNLLDSFIIWVLRKRNISLVLNVTIDKHGVVFPHQESKRNLLIDCKFDTTDRTDEVSLVRISEK